MRQANPSETYSGLIFPFGEIVIPSEARNLLSHYSSYLFSAGLNDCPTDLNVVLAAATFSNRS